MPGSSFSNAAISARGPGISSTSIILISTECGCMVDSIVARVLINEDDLRANIWSALNFELAANFLHALAHIAQAVSQGVVRRAAESLSIVFDADIDLLFRRRDAQADF